MSQGQAPLQSCAQGQHIGWQGVGRAWVQGAYWSVSPGFSIPVMCLSVCPPLPAMWVAACCSGFAACLLGLVHCAVQLPLYEAVRHALWAQRQRQQQNPLAMPTTSPLALALQEEQPTYSVTDIVLASSAATVRPAPMPCCAGASKG